MYKIAMVESQAAFEALKPAWQALTLRIPTHRFTQTYEWCLTGWNHRVEGDKASLKCLTLWQDEALVGVWAFKRIRKGVTTQLVPLGLGLGEEYAEPLFDEGYNTLKVCERVLRELKRHCDVLNMHFLVRGTPMDEAARRFKRPRLNYIEDAFVVDPTSASSWDDYMSSYSKNMRMQMRRSMNRLLAMGEVQLVLAEGPEQSKEIIDWLFEQKRNWLKARNIKRDWFEDPNSAALLQALAGVDCPTGRLGMFALKLNGNIIAASLNTIDQKCIEGMILTFDPAFAHYSPGMLILQETTRWGYERGLTHDLRIMTQDYKQRWVTQKVVHTTFIFGVSPLGMLSLARPWGTDLSKKVIRTWLPEDEVQKLRMRLKGNWHKPSRSAEVSMGDEAAA